MNPPNQKKNRLFSRFRTLFNQPSDAGYSSKIKAYYNELYDSRNILKSLIVKNLVGRYRNSYLGFVWHFITPIFILLVYYIVFTEIRKGIMEDYWLFLASGIFPFNFMISNLTGGSGIIINNSNLVKKTYFPREIIVFAQITSTALVMLIGYIIVLAVATVSGNPPSLTGIALLPIAFLLTILFTTGYTLIFSSIAVYIRDIQYILGTISTALFFVTPMYFTIDGISGVLKDIVSINPFTYYVELFHDLIYRGILPGTMAIIVTVGLTVISIMAGLLIFNKLKNGFAERL